MDIILTPPDETPLEVRQDIARKTVRNFRDHINKGFLAYRKSVTEAGNFANTEWTGQRVDKLNFGDAVSSSWTPSKCDDCGDCVRACP